MGACTSRLTYLHCLLDSLVWDPRLSTYLLGSLVVSVLDVMCGGVLSVLAGAISGGGVTCESSGAYRAADTIYSLFHTI